jgi:hypothetical protein
MDTSMNALAPGSGGPVAPEPAVESGVLPQPVPAPSPMASHFGSAQDQVALQYQRMQKATAMLRRVRGEMDKLMALADTVKQEDVVEAAGRMVADGLGSVQVAGILATMPQDGEALQAWVRQQDLGIQHREGQAERALALVRHELGLAAFRSIIGHSAEAQQPPAQIQPPPAAPPPNQLSLNSESPPNG